MYKVQLQATFTITDDQPVIEEGKLHAQADGGDPNMINTVGDALVELFNLIDDEGNLFLAIEGVDIESIDAVVKCASPGCSRNEHT